MRIAPITRFARTSVNAAVMLTLLCMGRTSQCTAQTKREEEIDVRYEKCKDEDTSCAHISGCAFEAYKQWEHQMTETYERLMHELKNLDEISQLKVTQEAWVTLKVNTFALYDRMYNIPGDKWCRIRHDARIDMIRERTLRLREYYDDLRGK